MKKIGEVQTDRFVLEVVECTCGYHMGVDSTYVEQVEDAFYEYGVRCPACGAKMLMREILGLPLFKVKVEVEREAAKCKTIQVKANNYDEAVRLAVAQAPNEDFGPGEDPRYQPTGGACPYSGIKVQRAFNFAEKRELWQPWNPRKKVASAFELMRRVIREKCKDSDYHKKEKDNDQG